MRTQKSLRSRPHRQKRMKNWKQSNPKNTNSLCQSTLAGKRREKSTKNNVKRRKTAKPRDVESWILLLIHFFEDQKAKVRVWSPAEWCGRLPNEPTSWFNELRGIRASKAKDQFGQRNANVDRKWQKSVCVGCADAILRTCSTEKGSKVIK